MEGKLELGEGKPGALESQSTSPGSFKVLVLSILCVISGAGNNVTFFQMGQRMTGFPAFLLYFTTACYVVLYFFWSLINILRSGKANPWRTLLSLKHQKQYAWLGFWITANGMCAQFADPYVNGNLQSVLLQLSLPATGVLAWIMLKERFNVFNVLGSMLVLGGCLMVALPPLLQETHDASMHASNNTIHAEQLQTSDGETGGSGQYNWIWIVVFALGVVPNGVGAVMQESFFASYPDTDAVLLLFWSNAYTLAGYLLAIPLSALPYLGNMNFHVLGQHQSDAFRCLLGHKLNNALPEGCEEGAWLPVIGFIISYIAFFYFLAALVQEVGAVFEALVNSIVTPASALVYASSLVMGRDTEPLTSWIIAAAVVVPLGVLIYKASDIIAFFRGEEVHSPSKLTQDSSHEHTPLLINQ